MCTECAHERHGDLGRQKAQFFTHPLNLPFAGCLRVTINFRKKGGPSMCDQFGSAKKYFFDRLLKKNTFFRPKKIEKSSWKKKVREAIWEVRSTPSGREATVTERAARSNPQRAVGEAHCELYVSRKVIDAHLKALSTPWWTESSLTL